MVHENTNISAKNRLPLSAVFINIYLFVMFTVFPLYVAMYFDGKLPFLHMDNGFVGIRHQKYYFFLVMTAIAAIAEVLLLLTQANSAEKSKPKNSFFDNITFTDWAALALVLCCAVSTVLSPYRELAFFGEATIGGYSQGRNNGLILILFYVLVYFLITRLYRCAEFVFIGLACSGGIVYLLTVLNGFYIDPLNMFANFQTQQNVFMEFFATIGNKNMLSGFICVTLPVIFTMSVVTKRLLFRVIYLVSTALGTMALIIGDSDSGLLGTAEILLSCAHGYARLGQAAQAFLADFRGQLQKARQPAVGNFVLKSAVFCDCRLGGDNRNLVHSKLKKARRYTAEGCACRGRLSVRTGVFGRGRSVCLL